MANFVKNGSIHQFVEFTRWGNIAACGTAAANPAWTTDPVTCKVCLEAQGCRECGVDHPSGHHPQAQGCRQCGAVVSGGGDSGLCLGCYVSTSRRES